MSGGRSDRDFENFMRNKKLEVEEFLNTLEAMVKPDQARKIVNNEENMRLICRSLFALMEKHYGSMEQLQLSEPQLAKHHQQVSEQMARRSKLLEGLSRMCIEIFKVQADACFTNSKLGTVNELHANILCLVTGNFHNFTDSSLEFCLSLSRIKFLFEELAKPLLSKWFPKHEVNDGCHKAVSACLGFTYNMLFRNNPFICRVLSEMKVVETVVPYLKSSNLFVQTNALLLIAFALDESNANMYGTARDPMEFLVSCLNESLNSPSRRAQGYHITELTVCLNRLALNVANNRLLVKLDLLPVLHRMCTGDRDNDIVAALDILFTLSHLPENCLLIEQQFLDILVNLFAKSEPNSKTGGLLRNYRPMQGLDMNLGGQVSAVAAATKASLEQFQQKQSQPQSPDGVEVSVDKTIDSKQDQVTHVNEAFKKLRMVVTDDPLRFHQRTGSNILLSSERLTATRQNSHCCYKESLVFSERPLSLGETLTLKIDFWDEKSLYRGSFSFGVTNESVVNMKKMPGCFSELSHVWGVWFENKLIMGKNSEQAPIELKARSGDTVGLQVSPVCGELLLFYNGRRINTETPPVRVPLSSPLRAVVDVYGPCCQVSIVPNASDDQAAAAAPQEPEDHQKPNQNPSPPQSPPGQDFDPTFETWDFVRENEKKKSIGSGGFGKVFQAFTNRHQYVAVKVIKPLMQNTPEAQRKIFEQEKRALELLSKVRHANVVRFLKAEESAGKYFIFCELLSGCTIYELMARQGQPIAEDGIRTIIGQTCSALSHLHGLTNPIIHRDIKSSNLMLTYSGTVKLIDFGFAREIATSQMVTHQQCGTLHFMAPEILTAEDEVVYTPKTDMWALGCTVFEMATASPPNDEVRQLFRLAMLISSKPMPQPPQSASSSLREFYQWCVQQQPGDRPTASDAMKHRFLAG